MRGLSLSLSLTLSFSLFRRRHLLFIRATGRGRGPFCLLPRNDKSTPTLGVNRAGSSAPLEVAGIGRGWLAIAPVINLD